MKIDGLHLLEGSRITNPVVANGASFPTGPTNPPDIGELFFLTTGNVGLYYCTQITPSVVWTQIADANMDPDLAAIAALTGTTGLLKKTAANTWSLDTTAYATQSGLDAVAGQAGKLMVGDTWPPLPEDYQMFYATAVISGSPVGFYFWDPLATIWTPIEPAAAPWSAIYGTPTTVAGYGITDAYTKVETDAAISAATPTFASLTGKPTTLAGYGITDAQALDADLTSIAGLAGTSGFLTKTGANTWSLDTNTYLTSHPSVSGATSANNSGLTYVQDLTFDANGHVTGIQSAVIQSASTSQEGVVQLSDSTSTTSSVLGATSTAVKSAYDLAAAALPKAGGSMTGSIVIPTNHHITLTDAPSNGTDAVNKNYVDGNLAGLSWKNSVKAATNGNITLSGTQTIDGIALVAGNRVLVKDQTTASENGIYVVAAGAWVRSTDMDATTPINEINSAAVFVEQGTTFADTGWTQVNNVSTVDSDAIAFTQFNGASGITAGIGLSKTGNTLNVNLGAGIAQLPTDEVGIDVYATGGLMTTVDGTNSSTLTNAQLSLTKVGTAGTYKSVTTDDFGRVTAGSNPTTLAGYGITDAQALDADLTAIAALAGTSGFLKKTAADTWTLDTTTYATDSLAMHLAGAETATGLKTFSAGIKLPDASTFYLGTDNDLAFSHSGVHGTITNNTGNLTIGTSATGGSLFLRTNNTSGSYIGILSADATVYANSFYVKTQSAGTTMFSINTGGASFSASVGSTGNMNCGATVTCSGFYTRQYIPLIASNGDLADNAYDRGWSYRWISGTNQNVGFFGLDKSTGKFTFVPDATITGDVVSGTKGTIDAYLAWADVTGKPTTLSGYGITDSLQPLDADLTAIAALAGTSGILTKTAVNTWSLDTTTYATDSLVVHLAGTETITGAKTFTQDVTVKKTDDDPRVYAINTSSTAQRFPGIGAINYSGGLGGYPLVELSSARGTEASPVAISSGDIIGSVAARGYNGTSLLDTAWVPAARINFVAQSTFNGTTDAAGIEFHTQSTTTLTRRMRVGADGFTAFYPDGITSDFYMGSNANGPAIAFDAADYIHYNRTTNTFNFGINDVSKFSLSSTDATFGGNLTVSGNLIVNGTTTTINATTLTVDDKNIELGSVTTPTNTTADGGGITLKGTTDKTIIWDNAGNNWTSSEHWNLVTGRAFKINNVDVLTATTLGSSVTASSLTSVGTITSGTWNAGAVTSSGVVTGTSLDTTYGTTTSGTLTTTAVTQVEVPLALSATVYRTVEYLVQATSGTTYHTSKVHVIHDGTNTWVDEYSTMFTSASLYTVTADISGGNIRLLVTPASATSTTFKVVANAIDV